MIVSSNVCPAAGGLESRAKRIVLAEGDYSFDQLVMKMESHRKDGNTFSHNFGKTICNSSIREPDTLWRWVKMLPVKTQHVIYFVLRP